MLNTIVSGSVKKTDLLSNLEMDFIQRKSCWVYHLIFIATKFVIWKQQWTKNYPSLINRKSLILHNNNACSHKAQLTKDFLGGLNWEKLLHTPYSPDLAPSDYHLFRGLQNHLDGLTSRVETEHTLVSYFASKPKEIYNHEIYKLVDRWNEGLGSNGYYVNDLIFL